MRSTLHGGPRREPPMRPTHLRGALVGLIGGLCATIMMDLFGAGLFVVMGGPASLSFSIIGDAAAGFCSMLGIAVAGGTPLGALLHYLIGLVLGGIFGAAVVRFPALRVDSAQKGIGFGILYVEVMSLPMLAAAALILAMTAAQTVQWFGISFVMHLIYGFGLGLAVFYGLRSTDPAVPG
jgi:hypothetical protein